MAEGDPQPTSFAFTPAADYEVVGQVTEVTTPVKACEETFKMNNVDLAYHWKWFDRELFLALWIIIFALLGFYLLGKLRFSHDSEASVLTLPWLFLALINLAFTAYFVPGLWGAPLRAVATFLPPPQYTQDFDLYTASLATGRARPLGKRPGYPTSTAPSFTPRPGSMPSSTTTRR